MQSGSESTSLPSSPGEPGLAVRRPGAKGWAELIELVWLFGASRILIVVVAGLSLGIVERGNYYTAAEGVLEWFCRWDAVWYLDVAEHGYHFDREGEPSNVVFLPLFPLLVRLASLGGLISLPVAGYAVANCCLLGAALWLRRLVKLEGGDPHTVRLVWACLFFGPVSFFFSAVYAEALFLMLSIGSICLARERRWWWAGVLGALVAMTRFIGFVIIVPLVWEMVVARRGAGGGWRLRDLGRFAPALLPLAGVGVFGGIMWIEFGDPLMYFRGQSYWDRHFSRWWILFARESFWGQAPFYRAWFAGTVVVAFGLLLLGVKLRLRSTYLIHGLVFGFFYISSRYVEGLPRYFSVVFPFYLIVGLACRRWSALTIPVLCGSSAMLALSVVLFVNGYWFT